MSSSANSNPSQPDPAAPLRSSLSADPDMVDLVQDFVEEMAERLASINAAARENDLGTLRTVAHQLKGSAAGYGFTPISSCAASLEQLIDATGPAAEVNSLREQVDELINLCRRASA